ncbi:MAG: NYN domain-containing protein [Fuerstiella sp.]
MNPYLIIDGYNLMHSMGIAKQKYADGELERCRNRMQRELANVLDETVLNMTTVVYDAFESASNDRRSFRANGMKIRFAPMGQCADSEIEELLKTHSVPKRILVVSSDHRLHKAANARKASVVDSEDFWSSLDDDE